MKKKIKDFFTTNLFLKIISLLLGIVVWIALSNTQDPVVTKVINVDIQYKNEDQLLANEGLLVIDKPESYQISVSVRQSKENQIRSDLFSCTADLVDHSGGDLSNQRVSVLVKLVAGSDRVLNWEYNHNDPNIRVSMDENQTVEFTIKPLIVGELTGELILETDPSFSPGTVTVSGPKSSFGNLNSVKALVDLDEISAMEPGIQTKTAELMMYDNNDILISNANGLLHMSQEDVIMSLTISKEKQLSVHTSGYVGETASGYQVDKLVVSPEQIKVFGQKTQINGLSEVVIPMDAIDVSGLTSNKEYQIDISQYLPEGVNLRTESSIVTVTAVIVPLETKTISIPTSKITLKNKNATYNYNITTRNVTVKIQGTVEDVSQITEDGITLVVDTLNVGIGAHRLPVLVEEISGITIANKDDLEITVIVSEEGREDGSEEESSSDIQESSETDTEVTGSEATESSSTENETSVEEESATSTQ